MPITPENLSSRKARQSCQNDAVELLMRKEENRDGWADLSGGCEE